MIDGMARTGLLIGDEVVDLTDPVIGLPGDMVDLLALGGAASSPLARAPATRARRLPIAATRLTAPVVRPPSFLAIARNYDTHIRELGHERPEYQTWFSKQPTSPSTSPANKTVAFWPPIDTATGACVLV